MERYADIDGDSGVAAYEIESDAITVEFKDGAAYRYSHESAGAPNVETMKQLARRGDGLNSFIIRNVRRDYEMKIR